MIDFQPYRPRSRPPRTIRGPPGLLMLRALVSISVLTGPESGFDDFLED